MNLLDLDLDNDELERGDVLNHQEVGLEELLRLLHERQAIDLRLYRRSTVERRVNSRIQKLGCQSYAKYAAMLASDPDESRRLLEHATIKVSRLFRDTSVFELLQRATLPEILANKPTDKKLYIWSAGCGHGEEPYSLSIVIAELARQRGVMPGVEIWATDVSEDALAAARVGRYPQEALSETSPELIHRYFTAQEERSRTSYQLNAEVREKVTFVRHDLLSASVAPGDLRFDLVLCRNVLIYFDRPAQSSAVELLSRSIAPRGFLCLGQAEQVASEWQPDFEVVDRRAKLYRKVGSRVVESS